MAAKDFSPAPLSKVLYIAILFLAVGTVAIKLGQGRLIWQTLQQGVWWWLAPATFLQLLFLLNQSALYVAVYQMAGLPAKMRHLSSLVVAAAFVAAVVPGGTMAGTGLMLYDARRRQWDMARVLVANILFFLFDYLAFFLVLAIAFIYLCRWSDLQKYELVATAILVALIAALASGLLLLATRPGIFLKMARKLVHSVNGFQPGKIAQTMNWDEILEEFTGRLSSILQTILRDRSALGRAACHALLVEGIGLLQLQALFLAFHQNPGLARLIIGYAIGVLFMIVSLTPQGVGLMEGAMTAAYASLGIPLEQAVLVTFIYRGLSFWLPMFCGLILFKRSVAQ
ncbi:lysylphosphatidylglycerol synthase transmembrane domain-containing protein [Moorella naiadis]|uniref:lysylphosphatidylglycerol synthase transmembrane domain-containing protein n=1 Tax=Moorella naiadis (nom. illeg.) TaxID=3093670 RepID=UPI003D9C909E